MILLFFFFNDTATTEIYTLSLHDALPIFRPLIANDEHVAALDVARENSLEGVFLAVEDARRAGHPRRLHTRDLRHAPFAREVAAQDGKMPVRIERPVPRADDLLILAWCLRDVPQQLGDRLPRDRQRVPVQHAIPEQDLLDLGAATRPLRLHRNY